jgi:hypothetical protein
MIYEVDGKEIWSHSLRPSQMFCGQITLLETLIGAASGVRAPGDDFVYIDPTVLRSFLRATFAYLDRSGSLPMRAMVTGVLQVALALDARASGDWLELPKSFDDIAQGTRAVL